MAKACSMVYIVCLFMKMHLLALLQDDCLDLVRCAFLRKLFACLRNITVFSQHLRPIKSAVLPILIYWQNSNIGPIYRPGRYISLSLLMCANSFKFLEFSEYSKMEILIDKDMNLSKLLGVPN